MRELCTPDTADADRGRVYELLVIDNLERVTLLDAEEVDSSLVDILELGSERVGQILSHNSAPQR